MFARVQFHARDRAFRSSQASKEQLDKLSLPSCKSPYTIIVLHLTRLSVMADDDFFLILMANKPETINYALHGVLPSSK